MPPREPPPAGSEAHGVSGDSPDVGSGALAAGGDSRDAGSGGRGRRGGGGRAERGVRRSACGRADGQRRAHDVDTVWVGHGGRSDDGVACSEHYGHWQAGNTAYLVHHETTTTLRVTDFCCEREKKKVKSVYFPSLFVIRVTLGTTLDTTL